MRSVPPLPMLLGLSGLLPALAAVAVLAAGPAGWHAAALASGFAYAALIYSFLGGMWWGLAAAADRPPRWTWPLAVVPSLIALACAGPWVLATGGRPAATIVLGAAILASPLVDVGYRRHGLAPAWWLGLRLPLSLGLGALTVAGGILGR